MSDTVMIVTGESSGELYGALLAGALRKRMPGLKILGTGGARMKQAGVELISGISSAFGITEAASSIRELKATFQKATKALREESPGVLVLIDYPDFNLRLAAEARKKGIRVLYYVSPQVWAWRKGRVEKIAKLVDRMAVVLPFEEKIYRNTGLRCEFVGHPVLDEIREIGHDKKEIRMSLGLDPLRPLLSVLPGSRPHELKRLLPVVLEVVGECRKEFEDFQFCVPFAPNTDMSRYGSAITRLREQGVVINQGESLRTLAASDYAVVASGTASLQAVLLQVPIVVMYKLFPLSYWLGRLIVDVNYISLVNILSGDQIVKELLQEDAAVGNIMSELTRLRNDGPYRERMLDAYGKVYQMFAHKKASERVAEMVAEMAGWP
jgi:lipid-A-disaccharide synthase